MQYNGDFSIVSSFVSSCFNQAPSEVSTLGSTDEEVKAFALKFLKKLPEDSIDWSLASQNSMLFFLENYPNQDVEILRKTAFRIAQLSAEYWQIDSVAKVTFRDVKDWAYPLEERRVNAPPISSQRDLNKRQFELALIDADDHLKVRVKKVKIRCHISKEYMNIFLKLLPSFADNEKRSKIISTKIRDRIRAHLSSSQNPKISMERLPELIEKLRKQYIRPEPTHRGRRLGCTFGLNADAVTTPYPNISQKNATGKKRGDKRKREEISQPSPSLVSNEQEIKIDR